MSGGSYNYLYIKDASDLLASDHDLSEMVNRLAGLDYAQDAAREAMELLLTVRQCRIRIETMQRRLQDIFLAVEWWDSADSGEEAVSIALKQYRGEEV